MDEQEHINLSDPRVAQAFNEWMRRYTEHPEQFGHEWQSVARFLKERSEGVEPTYGAVCAEYLRQLIREAH